jgi:hypothetical protein
MKFQGFLGQLSHIIGTGSTKNASWRLSGARYLPEPSSVARIEVPLIGRPGSSCRPFRHPLHLTRDNHAADTPATYMAT